ncbi:MAG: hypothetical protein R2823_01705 [Acidimicrobiia bacterium]
MEAEEYEAIPWSTLVADAKPAVDRRIYFAGTAVAAVVVLFLVMRFLGSTSPTPAATPATAAATVPAEVISETVDTPLAPAMPAEPLGSISEADLMAIAGEPLATEQRIPILVAEWFVTDYFTRDGSPETLASLEAALGDPGLAALLPHRDPDDTESFVEWARVFSIDEAADETVISVAYRTVTRAEDGFVRDPVRAVTLELANEPTRGWVVTSLPVAADLP